MNTSNLGKYLAGLLLAAAAAGCARQNATETAAPATQALTTLPELTSSAVSAPTPTSAPTSSTLPTLSPDQVPELLPAIEISDQEVSDSGVIEAASVTMYSPGWIVIFSDKDGEPDAELGFTRLEAGESQSVEVVIDTERATPNLHAALYADAGEIGEFQSPGPDLPVEIEGVPLQTTFAVEITAKMPELSVADQVIAEDGFVLFDSLTANKDSYLALYADENGEPGRLLGYSPVTAGTVTSFTVAINWRGATPLLHAVLYEDDGTAEVFEPETADLPVVTAGKPLTATFQVQYPPDILVINQPVSGGIISVDRAVSYGPGWLVVYDDDDGAMGLIIGWAHLGDGINELIEIEVSESAVMPVLHLLLHQDLEDIGEFGFPRTDPPVRFEDRFPQPVSFRTDGGSYLVTEDQVLGEEGTITIPLAVTDVDAWIVVRSDEEGEAGDVIGKTSIPAGVNRDVKVTLDVEPSSSLLHVILHLDAGEAGQFEYPEGLDIPLQRNHAEIRSPMMLLTEDNR